MRSVFRYLQACHVRSVQGTLWFTPRQHACHAFQTPGNCGSRCAEEALHDFWQRQRTLAAITSARARHLHIPCDGFLWVQATKTRQGSRLLKLRLAVPLCAAITKPSLSFHYTEALLSGLGSARCHFPAWPACLGITAGTKITPCYSPATCQLKLPSRSSPATADEGRAMAASVVSRSQSRSACRFFSAACKTPAQCSAILLMLDQPCNLHKLKTLPFCFRI